MSDPVRFLHIFAQALSTMTLYPDGHPARARVVDAAYEQLVALQRDEPNLEFSFLGHEVIYGRVALREMKDWDWSARLSNAGVQRLEFPAVVSRDEYEEFLDEILARLTLSSIDTTQMRPTPGRRTAIRFGAIGVRGEKALAKETKEQRPSTPPATLSLSEEADTVRWMHQEVSGRGELPLLEAEAIVRSLSLAMHGDNQIVIPLLQLREFDEYTTTHSLNVSVLAMALAEFLGSSGREVRAMGVAGLLHDLGKVRIPKDILIKPGKLSDEERAVMQRHPVDGARIILESEQKLDLAAAVAYEHHIMIDGGGYPQMHFRRDCHHGSKLVHVCDVYDALRTRRPYRDAWESEKVLAYIEERAGTEFDVDTARGFVAMMKTWERRTATGVGDTG
jgi:putative nucleotidyltransferase with HDIG domain